MPAVLEYTGTAQQLCQATPVALIGKSKVLAVSSCALNADNSCSCYVKYEGQAGNKPNRELVTFSSPVSLRLSPVEYPDGLGSSVFVAVASLYALRSIYLGIFNAIHA